MTAELIDNLPELCQSTKACVVLYSGGLDSSWFLLWARKHGIRTVAVHVHLNEGEPSRHLVDRAAALGAEYRPLHLTDLFADNFVAPAIQAGALYQGAYPVCSSLSRPLMAEAAIKIAREKSIECVVHTTTFMQNSAARFNNSLRAVSPDLIIGNPLIRESIGREEKRRQLNEAGISTPEGIYSIDANIWGRVIECGELDDPANVVPPSVWKLTSSNGTRRSDQASLVIGFENGLPVSLNGDRLSLLEIILRLNALAGVYGIGRYNGLEDTPFGIKNHEVREAPGATVVLTAHAALERAVLTQREIRIKSTADLEWTELVTNGFWHTPLREALSALIKSLSQLVNGEVVMEFGPGQLNVAAVRSPEALHFNNVEQLKTSLFDRFSYREFFEISALPLKMRARSWRPQMQTSLHVRVEDLP